MMKTLAALLVSLAGCAGSAPQETPPTTRPGHTATIVYVGTYTAPGGSKGIYRFELGDGGTLTPAGVIEGVANPSFVAISGAGETLYAACETADFQGKKTGSVAAFSIKDGQAAKLLNAQSSGGAGPCHVSVTRDGRYVFVANYGGGSVSMLPVKPDGSLGEPVKTIQHEGSSVNPQRQKGPHAHSINLAPDERFVFAADLGLDKILVYRFDAAKGTLDPNDPPFAKTPAGGGPRHFAFHPSGRFAFVCNEMTSSVSSYRYDAKAGTLTELTTLSTLPRDFTGGNSTAEVQVSPDGKFLYVSNRGHDSIAIFGIDQESGNLTRAGHAPTQGKTPRNFGIDPEGKFLIAANQGSNTLVVFRRDAKTGQLAPTGQTVEVPRPVCVRFVQVARP
jgi:6-phosphogluconolactonase